MPVDLSLSYGVWQHERASHALVVALLPGQDATGTTDRLRAAVAQRPDLAAVALWTERLPLPADDPRARMYRERELRHGCAVGVAPVRALVVEYADGASDLILTARRDLMGQAGLRWLAGVLCARETSGRETGGYAPVERLTRNGDGGGWGVAPRRLPTAPAWGLGDRRNQNAYGLATVDLADPPADPSAALALVLSRYESTPVRFAVVAPSACGGPDEVSLHGGDVTGATPIRDLGPAMVSLARGAQVLAEPPAVALLVVDDDGYRPGATPPFAITIVWRRGSTRLSCWYERAYLQNAIAEQFVRHLGAAATAIAGSDESGTDGGATVDAVALMTADETERVLVAGQTPAPEDDALPATIHAAVLSRARARPEAVAYSDEAGRLTYRQLDEAAGVVAGGLRMAGVVPGARVGVCLSRGPELIVVLLAILRAGAAYVPMDVRHPPQRLRFTTEDAGVGLVVTDATEFPAVDGVTTVHPEHLRSTGAPALDSAPLHDVTGPDAAFSNDVAYVIYTSGSTGRPKGVQVPHRNVVALLAATVRDMRLNQDDVWTWFHSAAFDVAVWEIWGALMSGARLVGVSTDVSRSPEDLYDLLGREGVTVLTQTPSAFGALTRVDAARRMSPSDGHRGAPSAVSTMELLALRLIIFCGETLDLATLREWVAGHPLTHCRLVNMFGITETTVHSTSHTITDLDVANRSRSVGRALPGWSVSVRDPQGRPVPFGVAGEVYVGGAGVADGYLNRPELTAERFVQDPHGGGRVYRSGDLGRLHPDGTLDHLGRLDSQVQLRGHRVELEEVRAVLLEADDVHAAAVVVGYAVPDDPDSARLDAYVVLNGSVGTRPTGHSLRRHLGGFLPEYMVPSTVTVLDVLPMTVNGKVDVGRLPAPARGSAAIDPEPAPEADESADDVASVQLRLAVRRVWAAIFQTPVADHDDFFELGGNSLLALRLSAGLREAGLPQITMRDMYLHPTIDDTVRLLTGRDVLALPGWAYAEPGSAGKSRN